MAYATMSTQVTGYVVLASDWNEIVNNFPQTFPGLITTDGDMVVATAANAGKRVAFVDSSDRVLHEQGGLEFDASTTGTGDIIVGQSDGVMGLETPMTQAQAEAGSDTQVRGVTALRIKQAIDALSVDLTQAEASAGAASQESVTWNTAFASTPVVVSSSDGTSGANSTEVFTVMEARSTTGATGDTTDVDGVQRTAVKTFIAQVS